MPKRSPFIVHWHDVVDADDAHYRGSDELLSIGSAVGRATGLTRIGVHHEILLPGRRTSWPHAEADEDELVFVIEGTPHSWIDGHVHALRPGDAVGFPRGTGNAHTFLNDSNGVVRLLVIGEASDPSHRIHYPMHAARNAAIGDRHWKDAPPQELGPHTGAPARPSTVFTQPTLETDRLVLRPNRLDDAEAIFEVRTQPDAMRYIPRTPPSSLEESEDVIRETLGRVLSLSAIMFAMTLRGDDRLRGIVALLRIDRPNETAEVGYEIHRDLWGQGFVREAVARIVAHGFDDVGLHRIELRVDPANTRSVRVAEALGFRKEAHLREHGRYPDGRRMDSLVFAKLATER